MSATVLICLPNSRTSPSLYRSLYLSLPCAPFPCAAVNYSLYLFIFTPFCFGAIYFLTKFNCANKFGLKLSFIVLFGLVWVTVQQRWACDPYRVAQKTKDCDLLCCMHPVASCCLCRKGKKIENMHGFAAATEHAAVSRTFNSVSVSWKHFGSWEMYLPPWAGYFPVDMQVGVR